MKAAELCRQRRRFGFCLLDRGAKDGLVPVAEWRRLQSAARPSLKQLLLSDQARADLVVPARGQVQRRKPEALL